MQQFVAPIEVKEELASGGELKNTYYRVKRGDTLGALARNYGTSVAQLQRMNNLSSTNLSVGKTIVVKQERVAPKSEPKSESVADIAQTRKMYPKVDTSSMLNSQGILMEYIERVNEENESKPLEVAIL